MCAAKLLRLAAAAALLAVPPAGWTAFDPVNDDTDIFLANPSFSATRPNVLIFLDNTANWGQTTGGAAPMRHEIRRRQDLPQQRACRRCDRQLQRRPGAVRRDRQSQQQHGRRLLALRRPPDDGGQQERPDGYHHQPRLERRQAGNAAVYSLAMAEMFKYFAGTAVVLGPRQEQGRRGRQHLLPERTPGARRQPDRVGRAARQRRHDANLRQPDHRRLPEEFHRHHLQRRGEPTTAPPSASRRASSPRSSAPARRRRSPSRRAASRACGWTNTPNTWPTATATDLRSQAVQNVITYTIDVMPKSTGQGPSHTALLKSTALNGKGKYFAITDATGTAQLENAFKSIFSRCRRSTACSPRPRCRSASTCAAPT